jgi:hypothetical protein
VPRPLLEIWRDLNRGRDGEPPSLLQQTIVKLEREMASPEYQARMWLKRAVEPKPLSPVERHIREMPWPEWQEKWRQRQAFLKTCGVAERVLGTPRPLQPDESVQPVKRKRGQGGGRHLKLTQKNIDDGRDIVRNNPAMSWKQLRRALRDAGINAGDTTLNTHIITPARASR